VRLDERGGAGRGPGPADRALDGVEPRRHGDRGGLGERAPPQPDRALAGEGQVADLGLSSRRAEAVEAQHRTGGVERDRPLDRVPQLACRLTPRGLRVDLRAGQEREVGARPPDPAARPADGGRQRQVQRPPALRPDQPRRVRQGWQHTLGHQPGLARDAERAAVGLRPHRSLVPQAGHGQRRHALRRGDPAGEVGRGVGPGERASDQARARAPTSLARVPSPVRT
jgi:hypothetical protein